MTSNLTQVAEVGFLSRPVLFQGIWLKGVYSVGRYRSGWGVYRATSNPHEPSMGEWYLWLKTGLKTKAEALIECQTAINKDMGL